MKNLQIPVFFACDDNYIPFLGVALSSMKENANKDYRYRIIVLNEGLKEITKSAFRALPTHLFDRICRHRTKDQHVKKRSSLRLRDYYSVAITTACSSRPFP
jgi:lipopolysaccharide biosynthesis glycosyltransferase